jgi:aldehyde dehydrogenase (NAD+)
MIHIDRFYARGQWQGCTGEVRHLLVNPVTEEITGDVRFGSNEDLERAVAAAREGFAHWSTSELEERKAALDRLASAIRARSDAFVDALREDIGCPPSAGRFVQSIMPLANLRAIREGIDAIDWEFAIHHSEVRRIPTGVVAGLTPWNAPLHQMMAKVAGVIGAGAAIVLKPSEVAPRSAMLFAEAIHEIDLPQGVFNLIFGGADLGRRLVEHPGIDMVSFTGSDAVGRQVMAAAAAAPKPVALELGGKSAAIVLRDANFAAAVKAAFGLTVVNSGQVCVCQSRLLLPRERMEEAVSIVKEAAATVRMGDPLDPDTTMGPLATFAQYKRVSAMAERARAQGARPILASTAAVVNRKGFFFAPTAFTNVDSASELAQREVFGPVLAMIAYDSEDDAVTIANSTPFGLSGAVWSADVSAALRVARRLRTGQVVVNGAPSNLAGPFGGFGHSGFGRENGRFSIEAFTQLQAINKPVQS